jgi:hypothetical protein
VSIRSFDITFKGIGYSIDVLQEEGDTTVYIEYTDIDEEIEQDELLTLTDYLVSEGFVEFKD